MCVCVWSILSCPWHPLVSSFPIMQALIHWPESKSQVNKSIYSPLSSTHTHTHTSELELFWAQPQSPAVYHSKVIRCRKWRRKKKTLTVERRGKVCINVSVLLLFAHLQWSTAIQSNSISVPIKNSPNRTVHTVAGRQKVRSYRSDYFPPDWLTRWGTNVTLDWPVVSEGDFYHKSHLYHSNLHSADVGRLEIPLHGGWRWFWAEGGGFYQLLWKSS